MPVARFARFVPHVLALLACFATGQMAKADSFHPIKDKKAFLSQVQGRILHLALYDVTITVNPNGTIRGNAMGWDLTGTWDWDGGRFCRQMDWSGSLIPHSCQEVEVIDGRRIRFSGGNAAQTTVFRIK